MGSQFEGTVHHSRVVMVTRAGGSSPSASAFQKQRGGCWVSLSVVLDPAKLTVLTIAVS